MVLPAGSLDFFLAIHCEDTVFPESIAQTHLEKNCLVSWGYRKDDVNLHDHVGSNNGQRVSGLHKTDAGCPVTGKGVPA